jgi:hypothetical protein
MSMITSDRDEFLAHMRELEAEIYRTSDGVEHWWCAYAGRDHVQAGTWDTRTNTGTLDLV